MENTILSVVGCLMLCASVSPQEQPRELRGGGHLLGETSGQFFSEGMLGICFEHAREKTGKV
jgi:hypothetical protein